MWYLQEVLSQTHPIKTKPSHNSWQKYLMFHPHQHRREPLFKPFNDSFPYVKHFRMPWLWGTPCPVSKKAILSPESVIVRNPPKTTSQNCPTMLNVLPGRKFRVQWEARVPRRLRNRSLFQGENAVFVFWFRA